MCQPQSNPHPKGVWTNLGDNPNVVNLSLKNPTCHRIQDFLERFDFRHAVGKQLFAEYPKMDNRILWTFFLKKSILKKPIEYIAIRFLGLRSGFSIFTVCLMLFRHFSFFVPARCTCQQILDTKYQKIVSYIVQLYKPYATLDIVLRNAGQVVPTV